MMKLVNDEIDIGTLKRVEQFQRSETRGLEVGEGGYQQEYQMREIGTREGKVAEKQGTNLQLLGSVRVHYSPDKYSRYVPTLFLLWKKLLFVPEVH